MDSRGRQPRGLQNRLRALELTAHTGFDKSLISAQQTQFVSTGEAVYGRWFARAEGYSDESFQPRCFQRNNPLRPRRFMCISWKCSYSSAAWLVDLR